MPKTLTITAAACLMLCAAAFAADTQVHQKGRAFSIAAATVKKGEAIVFVNDDTVPHNVLSESKGSEFDLGSQEPGTSIPVKFGSTGDVMVICAIHPKMKMTVSVRD